MLNFGAFFDSLLTELCFLFFCRTFLIFKKYKEFVIHIYSFIINIFMFLDITLRVYSLLYYKL